MFAGALLWLVASRIPAFNNSFEVRMLLSSGIITAYTWATAYEFWRGRSEPLVSRWPAIFMLFAHGALYLLRTPIGAVLPWVPATNQLFESVWLTVLSFEALLFTISIAFILIAMAKAPLKAEQFAFQKRSGDRRAIYFYKGSIPPGRFRVDEVGQNLFPGTALTENQNRNIQSRSAFDLLSNGLHCFRRTEINIVRRKFDPAHRKLRL